MRTKVVCDRCEAIYCDGACKGPYAWWFGVKFVVTKDLYDDMTSYYKELLKNTHIGRAWRRMEEPWRRIT